MTIRRQYSLPNCTLILEGLSDEMAATSGTDGRPLLSILVNAECHFVGSAQKLHGGRIFFEHLVKAVSNYAQECLSNVRHPQLEDGEASDRIHLEKGQRGNLHRLTWQPSPETGEPPVVIDLTTVQLFDLVEAIDQFFADSRTLPDLSLKLQPASRRYRQVDEPIVQRSIPAVLGIMSLALTGLALFFIPVPQVRKPEPQPQASPTETLPNSQTPSRPPDNPTPEK
jgi:hypothetical protein